VWKEACTRVIWLNQWSSTFLFNRPPRGILLWNRPHSSFYCCPEYYCILKITGNLVSTKQRTNKTNAIAFAEKMSFISKKQVVPTTANLGPGFLSVSFFKAGYKLVSLSRMAFPSVLFISWRLRYLLRMCSILVKPCSGKYVVGNSSSNNLTFPQTSGKRSLHLIQKSDHPC